MASPNDGGSDEDRTRLRLGDNQPTSLDVSGTVEDEDDDEEDDGVEPSTSGFKNPRSAD